MSLTQMSVSGAMFILAIVVIRALTINWFPKRGFLVLWELVLVRLLVPFSLPSAFSVYSLIHRNVFAERFFAAAEDKSIDTIAARHLPLTQEIMRTVSDTARPVSIWFVIWCGGAVALLACFTAVYLRLRFDFRTSLPVRGDFAKGWLEEHPTRRSVSVRQSGRFFTPLTYGVLHPVILMPAGTDWEDRERLRYIFLHEYTHIRHCDAVKKLILVLAVCLHWFNPLVWVMYVLFNRDIELACDESVVRQCGEKARSAYALMLIDMEAKKSGLAPFCSSFSKNAVEERITAIMKMKKMTVTSLILACGIVAGTTTVFATSVRPAGDAWETDEEMTATALRRLGEKHPNMIDWLDQCYSEEIVWWTWEAYEQMMNTRLEELEGMMGEYIGWTPSTGDIYVTPDMLEEQKKEYEEILTKLKDGWLIAKSVDGGENLLMEIDPDLWEAGRGMREFQCSISLKDGTEVVFGPYDSEEKMLAAVEPFCREQVKKGNMEQDEMDEIVKRYSEKVD